MLRRRLLPLCLGAAAALAPPVDAPAATVPAGATVLLSGSPSLLEPLGTRVGHSFASADAVSADGRYVVFASSSDGLVDDDDDEATAIYRKDLATGAVELVSRRDGVAGEPVHGHCDDASVSDDGRRVAFWCEAPLAPGVPEQVLQVYVRDVQGGTTDLVSRAAGDGPAGDGDSFSPDISGDGAYVAFASSAANLADEQGQRVYRRRIGDGALDVVSRHGATAIAGRTPSISDDGASVAFASDSGALEPNGGNGVGDIYVRDFDADTLTVESREGIGALGNGESGEPAISGDGDSVAFVSRATNLDGPLGDTDTSPDVYRRDIDGLHTRLVDVEAGGVKAASATAPSSDDDGDRIAFVTPAALDPADTNGTPDAYVKVLPNGPVRLLSRVTGAGGGVPSAGIRSVALNGDGTQAVLTTPGGDLAPDADPRRGAIVLRDDVRATTRLVSRPAGDEPFVSLGGSSTAPALSADGRYAAFVSDAPGLGVPLGVPYAVFRRDRVTGEVRLVSRQDGPGGEPFPAAADPPAISADGRRVAFTAREDASGGPEHVWVRDVASGRTILASRASGVTGTPAGGRSSHPRLDADGSRVAFVSTATNLDLADTKPDPDVFVRDLDAGRTMLASRADGPGGGTDVRPASAPDLDAAGRRVSFVTEAPDLTADDDDHEPDAFVRDVDAGTTRLVSTGPAGNANGSVHTSTTSIDAAGTRVAFVSDATNLGGPPGPGSKAYVRDLGAGTTALASRADGPEGAPLAATAPVLSPDGGVVAFSTGGRIARRELGPGRTTLIDRGGDTYPAELSDGGRCLAYDAPGAGDAHEVHLRAFATDCALPGPPAGPAAPVSGGAVAPEPPASAGAAAAARTSGPRAASDATDPRLSALRLDRTRLRRGRTKAALRFRASAPGTLTVAIERRCTRPACTTFRRTGGALSQPVRAGAGRVVLDRRLRRLAPGRYRLTVRLQISGGRLSRPVTIPFRILEA